MKCAVGQDGTGTSRWRCWPTPTSLWSERKRRPASREQKGAHAKRHRLVDLLPLTVPEVRRLVWWLVWVRVFPQNEVLDWSQWRHRHQAMARRWHYKRRARAG